ncbi:MAG: hypothetical protein MUO53_08360 [Maribacter sp.]|nr:hypothetical protein [Maribacter sp.]
MKATKYVLLASMLPILFLACQENGKKSEKESKMDDSPWFRMTQIIDSIDVPIFPDKILNVLDFGAVSNGATNNTEPSKMRYRNARKVVEGSFWSLGAPMQRGLFI